MQNMYGIIVESQEKNKIVMWLSAKSRLRSGRQLHFDVKIILN